MKVIKTLINRHLTEPEADESRPGVMRLRLIPSKMREYDGTVTSTMAGLWIAQSLWRTYTNNLPVTIFATIPFYFIWATMAAFAHGSDYGIASVFHSAFLLNLIWGMFFYLYMLFLISLEVMIFSLIPALYPKALNLTADGFSVGRRKRFISWNSVKFVQTKRLLYRTMRHTTVLEFYLPEEALKQKLSPFERVKDWFSMRQFCHPTTFLDPTTRKLHTNPYEGTCIRIPLDLLAFESDKRSLLQAVKENIGRVEFDEELPESNALVSAETFTTLWLDQLRAGSSSSSERLLLSGHKLQKNRYTIGDVLGHGGFSVVYSAEDADKRVAIKELVIGSGGTRASKEAILKQIAGEIELLKRLDHPNIVKCRDYFIEAGRIYVVMEALEGLNLRDYVDKNGKLPPENISNIAEQCFTILQYLHDGERKIIHRDFTPDNLIWDGERVMLIDFNVAEDLNTAPSPTIVGKQCYLAPEQWSGIFTERGDLYQLGCTLFFLGTGRDPEPLKHSSLAGERADIDPKLCQLVESLTALQESERPENARSAAQRMGDSY